MIGVGNLWSSTVTCGILLCLSPFETETTVHQKLPQVSAENKQILSIFWIYVAYWDKTFWLKRSNKERSSYLVQIKNYKVITFLVITLLKERPLSLSESFGKPCKSACFLFNYEVASSRSNVRDRLRTVWQNGRYWYWHTYLFQ